MMVLLYQCHGEKCRIRPHAVKKNHTSAARPWTNTAKLCESAKARRMWAS